MKSLVIFVLGLVAHVKSDIGITGYRYNVPSTSYDVPFGSVGGITNDRKYYHIDKQPIGTGSLFAVTPSSILPTASFAPVTSSPDFASVTRSSFLEAGNLASVTPSSIFQTPIHEHSSFTGSVNFADNKVPLAVSQTDNELSSNLHYSGGNQGLNFLGGSLNRNTENTQNILLQAKSSFSSGNSQNVEVQRHLYFYAAPEEPEEVRTRIVAPPPSAKKNVKILFIKTPSFNSAPISIPALPQNEEKTLVYVLVKKPDESSIVIPTAEPAKPSKPEVYFIKYKTQREAEEAVSNVQQGSSVTGVSSATNDFFNAGITSNVDNIQTQQSPHFYNAGVTSNVHNVQTQQSPDLFSRISSVNEGGTVISQTPTAISAPSSSGIQVSDGLNEFSGVHSQFSSTLSPETLASRINPSDYVTHLESSTISSLNLPTPADKATGEIKVHQVYGPPRNR